MEHTSNYNLSQWAGEDRILREDFNADNAKIEAALANATTALAQESAARAASDTNLQNLVSALSSSSAKLHFGTYIGNNASSQTISLGFTPSALLVCIAGGIFTNKDGSQYGGLAFPNKPCVTSKNVAIIQIVTNGFTVYYDVVNTIYTNTNCEFYYIAVE